MSRHDQTKYFFAVTTNDIHEAIAIVARELRRLIKQGIITHGKHVSVTCEFAEFGRDVLAALEAYPKQWASREDKPGADA
jgi:hypothetical protein